MGVYVTRAEWGARPPKAVKQMTRSDGIAWHDVGIPGDLSPAVQAGDRSAISAQLRNMQNMHMDTNYLTPGGGTDIAYSFAVAQNGDLYELRGWNVAGGHTMGANSTCHGVLFLIGNGSREAPTPAARATAQGLLAEHARRYGGGWSKGHREVAGNPSGTSCPGDAILRVIHDGFPSAAPLPPPPPKEDEMVTDELLRNPATGAVYLATTTKNTDGSFSWLKRAVWLSDNDAVQFLTKNAGLKLRDANPVELSLIAVDPNARHHLDR